MNRSQFVDCVAKKLNFYRPSEISNILKTMTDTIAEELKHGHIVSLRGFGTFKIFNSNTCFTAGWKLKSKIQKE